MATPRNDWRLFEPADVLHSLVEAADMLGIDIIILTETEETNVKE